MKRRMLPLLRSAAWVRRLCLALGVGLLAGAVAAQGYQVRPGDVLRIEVLEDASINRSVLVAPDGRISVPQAGTVSVRGLSIESIQNNLTQRLAGNFASTPNVFVSIERLAEQRPAGPVAPMEDPTIAVYVMGEVGRPGRLEVAPGTNVLQMFAIMGGFTKFAATKRIQLRSEGSHVVRQLNYDVIEAGGAGGATVLRDGDVIVVPQRRLFE